MKIQLRPYQKNAVQRARESFAAGRRKVIMQIATGGGKTVVGGSMIETAISKGKRALFFAHRKELIDQTSEKFDQYGIEHGIIMADHWRRMPSAPLQIASIQTLTRRQLPPADLVVVDECHLSCSPTYQNVIKHYADGGSAIIGLTATPTRLDGQGLGIIYDEIISVTSVAQLTADGWLVPVRHLCSRPIDTSSARTRSGKLDEDLAEGLIDQDGLVGDIVAHWLKLARGRKTILFAHSVRHSQHICEQFRAAGVRVAHVDAKTPKQDRERILEDLKAHRVDVVCNYGLYIEGLDVPDVSCVIFARITDSLVFYMQGAGRGMRPAPGKKDLIVLDHGGLAHRHGFVEDEREWSLDGSVKRKNADDQEYVPELIYCEGQDCFMLFDKRKHPNACPHCGWLIPKKEQDREIEHVDGELVEMTEDLKDAIRDRRARELKAAKTLAELVALGQQRGYKYPELWAQHRLKEREAWRQR